MTGPLGFDALVQAFHQVLDHLPDARRGKNMTYTIKDAALGAFAVFFTQAPSFLAHQRTLRQAKGISNAERLFGMTQIPGANQIRTLLDPIPPDQLCPMFRTVTQALVAAGTIETFQVLDGTVLIALDGTQYFSSPRISCPNCSHKTVSSSGENGLFRHFGDPRGSVVRLSLKKR